MKRSLLHQKKLILSLSVLALAISAVAKTPGQRPNILFAISDDQSFAHTGFAGCKFVKTPAFDRVAREGIYFNNCIAGSPGCAPSRSTIITGRYHWQNEQSGQHASSWMKKYVPFIDLLDANGYVTGLTGKGVAPFQYARDEKDSLWRATDAGGIEHSSIEYQKKSAGDERTAGGIGELENTIVIVTADNGMPFPRAKANGYDYGIHVPLAIRYPKDFPGGRIVDDPVGFADIAPTILELTGTSIKGMMPISGKSILNILKSKKQGIVDPSKKYVFSGRERHSSSRYLNWGYPQRMIRSQDFLLTWNMKPERWPAGDPQAVKPNSGGALLPMYGIDENGKQQSDWAFADIDDSPTKAFIIENWKDEKIKPYFDLALAKRPEFEFFNLKNDPYCLVNLAGNPNFSVLEKEMKNVLMKELVKSKDPRVVGPDKEVFDLYIRYSPIREFPRPN